MCVSFSATTDIRTKFNVNVSIIIIYYNIIYLMHTLHQMYNVYTFNLDIGIHNILQSNGRPVVNISTEELADLPTNTDEATGDTTNHGISCNQRDKSAAVIFSSLLLTITYLI